jgi:hypothetical protein
MATDRDGNTISNGDDVVLIGKTRKVDYASGKSIVVVGGQPLHVVNAEVLLATALGGGGGVTDHGALTGLTDDDHALYALVNGARAFTGDVTIDDGVNDMALQLVGLTPANIVSLATGAGSGIFEVLNGNAYLKAGAQIILQSGIASGTGVERLILNAAGDLELGQSAGRNYKFVTYSTTAGFEGKFFTSGAAFFVEAKNGQLYLDSQYTIYFRTGYTERFRVAYNLITASQPLKGTRQMYVVGSVDEVQFEVTAFVTQTADLLRLVDSAGTKRTWATASGLLKCDTNPADADSLVRRGYLGGAATLNVGTAAGTVAAGDHGHADLLPVDGSGSMAGDLDLGGFKAVNLADPVGVQDAATAGWSLTQFALLAQNLLDLPNKTTARTNLGLGGLATLSTVATAQIDDAAVTLAKTENRLQQILRDERYPFLLGQTGWSAVLAGTGSWGQQKPRYNVNLRDLLGTFRMRVTTAGGTTGTNAAAIYVTSIPFWLADGFGMSGIVLLEVLTEIQRARWGFIGNDVAPSASAVPAYGIWFSVDRGTYGDDVIRCHTANGGAVTTTSTGITAVVNTNYHWAIEFESTSSVKFYLGTSMPTSPTATHTTGIPNGAQPQQGTPFMQVVKIDPASASWGGLISQLFRIHLSDDRLPERYA